MPVFSILLALQLLPFVAMEADMPRQNGTIRWTTRRSEAGFSLFEILVASAVLSVAACAVTAAMIHGMAVGAMNTETQEAQDAARKVIEDLSSVPVREVFARYNTNPEDDPTGYETAVGNVLSLVSSTGAKLEAEIIFPNAGDVTQIREDVQDPVLGLPRDLNADSVIDDLDHSQDYVMLPVRVRVTWQGVTGERSLDMCSVLLDR